MIDVFGPFLTFTYININNAASSCNHPSSLLFDCRGLSITRISQVTGIPFSRQDDAAFSLTKVWAVANSAGAVVDWPVAHFRNNFHARPNVHFAHNILCARCPAGEMMIPRGGIRAVTSCPKVGRGFTNRSVFPLSFVS